MKNSWSKDEKGVVFLVNTSFSGKAFFPADMDPTFFRRLPIYAAMASILGASNNFDVIHAMTVNLPGWHCGEKWFGNPWWFTYMPTDFDRGRQCHPGVYDMKKEEWKLADRVIGGEQSDPEYHHEKYGIIRTRL